MSSVKFTNATLEKFLSVLNPEGKRRTIWDSEARGLGAYQTKNGVCTLFTHYRLANGMQKKQVLARFKEISLDEARHLAQKYRVAAKQGIALATEQKKAEPSKQSLTIAEAYREFTEAQHRRENSPNTIRLNSYSWRNHLSRYQDRDMASVSKHDVRAWHREWGKSGPTVAN